MPGFLLFTTTTLHVCLPSILPYIVPVLPHLTPAIPVCLPLPAYLVPVL